MFFIARLILSQLSVFDRIRIRETDATDEDTGCLACRVEAQHIFTRSRHRDTTDGCFGGVVGAVFVVDGSFVDHRDPPDRTPKSDDFRHCHKEFFRFTNHISIIAIRKFVNPFKCQLPLPQVKRNLFSLV